MIGVRLETVLCVRVLRSSRRVSTVVRTSLSMTLYLAFARSHTCSSQQHTTIVFQCHMNSERMHTNTLLPRDFESWKLTAQGVLRWYKKYRKHSGQAQRVCTGQTFLDHHCSTNTKNACSNSFTVTLASGAQLTYWSLGHCENWKSLKS